MHVALAFLRRFGVECGTDLQGVLPGLGLELRVIEATTFDGALLRVRGIPKGFVVLNRRIADSGRRRFTLAHEIGHYVHPEQQDACSPCGSEVIGFRAKLPVFERQANQFAAEVLMPRDLFAPRVKASPTFGLVHELAARFGTSVTSAACRLAELSSHRVAVVRSVNGIVSWAYASPEFRSRVRGGTLGGLTVAHRLFSGEKAPEGPTDIPADEWLSSSNLVNEATVSEESIFLPLYSATLTLLVIGNRIERWSEYDEEETEPLDPREFSLKRTLWPT